MADNAGGACAFCLFQGCTLRESLGVRSLTPGLAGAFWGPLGPQHTLELAARKSPCGTCNPRPWERKGHEADEYSPGMLVYACTHVYNVHSG